MSDSDPFVLYDIASPLQPRSYAPNPSKARLTLSFKAVPFKTQFIELLDISETRQSLNCPATRKLDDGSDYYTLPMVREPSSGKVLGDTFDIATYLDDHFPDSGGQLFPPKADWTGLGYESPMKDSVFYAPITTNEGHKHAAYAKFNLHVDTTFSSSMALFAEFLPFNPPRIEETKAMFAKRAHLKSWDDLNVRGEARTQMMTAMKENMASLADLLKVHPDGPYFEGKEAHYPDLIVGGWLNMLATIMPKEEWEQLAAWHDGVFGKLHEALQERYFVCT